MDSADAEVQQRSGRKIYLPGFPGFPGFVTPSVTPANGKTQELTGNSTTRADGSEPWPPGPYAAFTLEPRGASLVGRGVPRGHIRLNFALSE